MIRTKRLRKREKYLLAAAAAATVLFVVGKWYVLPFLHFEAGVGELVEEKMSIMSSYQAIVARESLLTEEKAELEALLEEYDKYLLPPDAPPLAAAALETRLKEMAVRSGLNVVSNKILEPRSTEFFVEIPVRIVARGGIENFRDFIVLMENGGLFIEIQEMNLTSRGAGKRSRSGRYPGGGGDIQATLIVAGLIAAPENGEEG